MTTHPDETQSERERGSGLMLVMITLVVVSMLVEGVLTSTQAESKTNRSTTDHALRLQTRYTGEDAHTSCRDAN